MATHDPAQLHYTDPLVQSPSATNQWMACQQLWLYTQKYGLRGEDVQAGRKIAGLIHQLRGTKAFRPVADDEKHLAQLAYLAVNETSRQFGAPLYTELTLGKSRLDEVFATRSTPDFLPTIIEYKYFPFINDEEVADYITERFAFDHQLMHYAWAYLQYVNRWHSTRREASIARIGVCVLTTRPKPLAYTAVWEVTKTMLVRWLGYAIDVWQHMIVAQQFLKVANQVDMPRNLKSCYGTVYGQCNMYKRCWVPSA